MVSATRHEGECPFLKQNAGSDSPKCHQLQHRGIQTDLYLFGASEQGKDFCEEFPVSTGAQNLLEALILSQWEDHASKGQVNYDITTCEIKILPGGKKFIVQLNENWNPNFHTEFVNNMFQPSRLIRPSYMRINSEDILLCLASGEKEIAEYIPSTLVPRDGILIILNAYPIEYGHIFLVPHVIPRRSQRLDKRTFQLITQIAAEMNNSSFRIFSDYNASMDLDHMYFQANYFADLLPVELLPTVPVYGNLVTEGIHICEVTDYPLKALVFMSKTLQALVEVVAEVCSTLQDHSTSFNLLISDCGTKMFLFPQVRTLVAGHHISTWECAGYFICSTRPEFDSISETELSEVLSSVSPDDNDFEALKQLSCSIAAKITP